MIYTPSLSIVQSVHKINILTKASMCTSRPCRLYALLNEERVHVCRQLIIKLSYTILFSYFELSHTLIKSPQAVGTGHHSQSHKNQNDRNLHHVELIKQYCAWSLNVGLSIATVTIRNITESRCGLSKKIATISYYDTYVN